MINKESEIQNIQSEITKEIDEVTKLACNNHLHNLHLENNLNMKTEMNQLAD